MECLQIGSKWPIYLLAPREYDGRRGGALEGPLDSNRPRYKAL